MYKLNILLTLAVAFGLVLAGCDGAGIRSEDSDHRAIEAPSPSNASASQATDSDASSHLRDQSYLWYQRFDQDTDGWITDETAGPKGWCGDITQVNRGDGPVAPSASRGYALAAHGKCNDYWSNHGFPNGSGPYSPAAWTEGPTGDHVLALDIYLDPGLGGGTTFTLAAAIRLLDGETPTFRYFLVPVTKNEGKLFVAGHEVPRAGWYTLRYRFTGNGGALSAEFQLVRNFVSRLPPFLSRTGVLFTVPFPNTAFTGEPTSSFSFSNVGNGYLWFVSIAEGLMLPIDEHRVRQLSSQPRLPEIPGLPSAR